MSGEFRIPLLISFPVLGDSAGPRGKEEMREEESFAMACS